MASCVIKKRQLGTLGLENRKKYGYVARANAGRRTEPQKEQHACCGRPGAGANILKINLFRLMYPKQEKRNKNKWI